jgi:hypothetical protein
MSSAESAPIATLAPPATAAPGAVLGDMTMTLRATDSAPLELWVASEPLGGGAEQVEWDEIAGTQERHIIQRAEVELETEEFDGVVSELRALAPAANGYVESEMLTQRGRRMFTIVMRIPAAQFEITLRHVESLAEVRSMTQRADDVTDQFYDIVGSLETRLIEEERILALIDVAENVNEILALEARLSNTRLTIQSHLAQLNNMAGLIAYSTIVVTLHDTYDAIVPAAAPTLGERIGGAFGDSVDGTVNGFQNIVVFLAGAIIPLFFIGLFAFGLYKIIRMLQRRQKQAMVLPPVSASSDS